mgnify:CR=1 FL=1
MQKNYFKYENYTEHSFPVYSSIRKDVKTLFTSHFHKDAEIVKVIKGTIKVSTGTEQYILSENDIIFFSPFSVHRAEAETVEVETHAITFDPDIIKKDVDYTHIRDSHLLFDVKNPLNKEVSEIFDSIFDAYWGKKGAYKLRITSGLLMISALLTECNFILSDDSGLKKLCTLPAIEYIKKNYNSEIRVAELAELLNFCPEHFTRIFKKENKKTPVEYITDYRIGEALKLLSENKYSISEIANMTGFSSSSHFVKVFRQKLNTTPGKYYKQNN